MVKATFNVQPATMNLLAQDPVSQLLAFIFNPDIDDWRLLSRWMPYLFVTSTNRAKSSAASIAESASSSMNGASTFSTPGTDICWSFSTQNIVLTAAVTSPQEKTATAVLAIDDRNEVLDAHNGSGWREWLRMSNWFGISGNHRITTRTQLEHNASAAPAVPAEPSLDPLWQALLEQTVSDAERELVKLLAAHSGLPVPELGHEAEDGSVLDLAWPDQRIAVVLDPESMDTESLIADGWQLCGADVPNVVERLPAAGRI